MTRQAPLFELYSWGSNANGQTGQATTSGSTVVPTRVGSASDWVMVALSGSPNHSLAINSSGQLFSWGLNSSNQLGLGDTTLRSVPTQIGSATNWTKIAVGTTHSLAINADGELYAWGLNSSNQLGLGDTTTRSSPTKVGSATNWVNVAAGAYSAAINSDGELYTWGSNSGGQTAQGTVSGNTTTPTKVGSATDWVKLYAGTTHGLAINSSGQLFSWGVNVNGATGLGTTTGNTLTPTQIGSASNWATAAGGGSHSLAVNNSGELYSWGNNANGRTGLATTSGITSSPTRVGSASNWVNIGAGQGHSLAINSSKQLFSWGNNGDGRTGLATTSGNTTTPTQVGTDTDWTLSFAAFHSLGITTTDKDQLYIDLGYFTPEDYYVYIAGADATASSIASISSIVGIIKQSQISLSSSATLSAIISHIEGADLLAFTDAQLTTDIEVIRNVSATLLAEHDQVTVIEIIRLFESTISSEFSISAEATLIEGGIVQEAEANLSSEFTQTTDVNLIKTSNIELSSEFAQTTDISLIKTSNIELSSEFAQTVDVNVITDVSLQASSEFTQTATISHIEGADIVANGFASVEVSAVLIKDVDADLNSNFDIIISTLGQILSATVTASSEFTQTVQGNLTQTFDAALSSEFAQTAVFELTRDVDLTMSSEFAQTAVFELTRDVDLTMSSEFTQSTDVGKIMQFAAEFTDAFDSTLSANAIVNPFSTLEVTAIMSTDFVANRSADIALENIANLDSQGDRSAGLNSSISSSSDISVTSTAILSTQVSLSSSAELTVITNSSTQAQATLSLTATQTANAGFLDTLQANLNSAFNIFTSRYFGSTRPRQWAVSENITYSDTVVNYGSYSLNLNNVVANSYIRSEISNDYIIDNLKPSGQFDEFVIEGWFYRGNDADAITPTQPILVKLGNLDTLDNLSTTTTQWALGQTFTGATLQFKFSDVDSGTIRTIGSSQALPKNTWFHVAVRRGSDNVIRLLYNNTQVGSLNSPGRFRRPTSTANRTLVFYNAYRVDISSPFTSQLYVDEFSYRIGSSTVSGYSSSIRNEPSTQVILQHFENTLADDITVLEQAQITAGAISSVTAILSGQQLGQANLSSVAALVLPIERIRPNEIITESIATQLSVIGKVGDVLADLSTAATLSVDAIKIVGVQSSLSSTAEQDITTTLFKDYASSLESISTTDAQAVVTANAESLQDCVASVDATALRIFDFAIATESIATQLTAVTKVGDYLVDVQVTSTLAADVVKTATVDSAQQVTTETSILADRFASASTALTSESSLDIIAKITVEAIAVLSTDFNADISVDKVKNAESALSTDSQLSILIEITRNLEASLASEVNQTALVVKTVDPGVATESISIQLTAVAKVGDFLIDTLTVSSLAVSVDKTSGAGSLITAEASAVIDAVQISSAVSSQLSEFVQTTTAEATKPFDCSLTASTEQTADNTRVRFAQSNQAATTAFTAIADKLNVANILAASTTQVTVSGDRLRGTLIPLASIATLGVTVNRVASASANFVAFNSQLSTGNIIHIDPDLTYMIPREVRTRVISPEIRERTVAREQREYII